MNYYVEIEMKIKDCIDKEDYLEAFHLIKEELSQPYVPSDFENKLNIYRDEMKPYIIVSKKELNIDKVKELLNSDEESQLRAVTYLDSIDLNNEYELINEYLKGNGFKNAKVLLIDSLIRQEINQTYVMNDNDIKYTFIPKYLLLPEESDGYLNALKIIEDRYLKEPSKLELSKQLLYKETLLALPVNFEHDEGKLLASKVIDFIEDAFK